MNNTAVSDALESLLAKQGMTVAGTDSDLVIDEFDRWHNPENTFAVFTTQTFNLVVVAQKSS